MYEDPIVAEVRQAGQALVEQAEDDLPTFFNFYEKSSNNTEIGWYI